MLSLPIDWYPSSGTVRAGSWRAHRRAALPPMNHAHACGMRGAIRAFPQEVRTLTMGTAGRQFFQLDSQIWLC
jgi:hypothetical protein